RGHRLRELRSPRPRARLTRRTPRVTRVRTTTPASTPEPVQFDPRVRGKTPLRLGLGTKPKRRACLADPSRGRRVGVRPGGSAFGPWQTLSTASQRFLG